MDEDKYTDKQVCEIIGDNHFSNLLQYVLYMFGTMPRSMTEEEIIQYLKMNKNIGIVFKFMPEEVKEWCRKYSKKLYWYDMDILVDCWSNGGFEKRLYDDKVYTLSEDYKHEKPEQIKDFDNIKFLRKDTKMTEQEIVLYLKENKTSGIAVGFLPEEVRAWVYITPISIFMFFDGKGWIKSEKTVIRDNDIICLPDNYELKKIEKSGEWIEFDINKNGDFEIGGIANDKNSTVIYNWSQWNKPIRDNASKNFINGCCGFGGYLYAGCNDWFMTPRIFYNNRLLDHYQKIEIDGKMVKPAIPVKIRFWKEIK